VPSHRASDDHKANFPHDTRAYRDDANIAYEADGKPVGLQELGDGRMDDRQRFSGMGTTNDRRSLIVRR